MKRDTLFVAFILIATAIIVLTGSINIHAN